MQRAHGMDASFLAFETPTTPMHTMNVSVHGPVHQGEGLTFEAVRAALARRVPALPLLVHRPLSVPCDLAPPFWVYDRCFDIDRHLHHVRLAGDASMRDLWKIVSDFAARPLRRDRPLWELMFVEGLEGGRTAEVLKLHHALSDGGRLVSIFERVLFATSCDALEVREAEPLPSSVTIAKSILAQFGRSVRFLPRLFVGTLIGIASALWKSRGLKVSATGLAESRDVSFNQQLSSRREFAAAKLPFARIRGLAEAAGCSVNDAFLAVCSGALAKHLDARHEVPTRALVASVPMALGKAPYPSMRGNRVSNLFADLATDEPCLRRRLNRIRTRMDAAKSRRHWVHRIDVEQWMDQLPPLVLELGVRLVRRLVQRHRIPAPVNLVLSNVHGPDEVLHRCDNAVVSQWFVGPLIEGVGLNITAWTYAENMHVGLLACPECFDDIHGLAERFESSLEELEQTFMTCIAQPPTRAIGA